MTGVLLILLAIFLYYIIKVGINLYGIYRKVHDAANTFRQFNGRGPQYGNNYGNSNAGGSNGGQGYQRTAHTAPNGDVIEDRRTEDEINRKIFTQEEGEYVDFEEVN